MSMKPDQAAKVLREHNAWRRGEVTNPMPYNAPNSADAEGGRLG